MTSKSEKRISSRRLLQIRVVVTSKLIDPVEARTIDLSRTGICVYTQDKLKVGEIYTVTFDVMQRGSIRKLSLQAEVVFCTYRRTGDFKVGMRFLETDPASDALMAEFTQNN